MDKLKSIKQAEVTIDGNVSGQVAIGDQITQTQTINSTKSVVSQAELEALNKLIEDLKLQVTATATPEQKDQALERVSELQEAITAEKPDLTTMEYVKNWFGKNLPQLAGAITGLVVHPIVGKLVEAAGEALTHEFKRRFGVD